MEEELPNEFDLIVVGTGFSESIVAAAASRIGKTVLHLDPNEFYGGVWASFNLESFQNFLNKTNTNKKQEIGAGDNERDDVDKNFKIIENCCDVINATQEWHVDETNPINDTDTVVVAATTTAENPDATDISQEQQQQQSSSSSSSSAIDQSDNEENWTKDKVMKNFRKFNIDLIPRILYGNGKLVKLLIKSNICRYAEFRAIDKILTIYENEIKNVPCTRSDVFSSSDLKMIEKRLLMKLLTTCMNYNKNDDDDDDKDSDDDPYDYFNDKENKKHVKNDNEEEKSTENDDRKEPEGEEKQDTENNDDNKFTEYKNKTFLEYLQGQKLTDKIIHCVLYSISMCNKDTMLLDGIRMTKKFLNSLGRYGNTPFLFPMYGCGELPQDFCRLCAVFGGIYCLKRSIDSIKIENDDDNDKNMKKITTVLCNKQNIKVNNLVIGSNNIPNCLLETNEKQTEEKAENNEIDCCGNIARGVFITSKPIGDAELNSGGGGVNIMRLPNKENDDVAFVIQLSHYSGTCPKGLYLIHIITKSKTNSPENDLKSYTTQIFSNKNDNDDNGNYIKILYSAYFIINKCKNCEYRIKTKSISIDEKFSNLYLTCGPYYEFDYDKSINNAYKIFKKLYPNDEFLPRAPDPEEIIIGDEDPLKIENDNKTQEIENNETIDAEKCITDNTKNEEKDINEKN